MRIPERRNFRRAIFKEQKARYVRRIRRKIARTIKNVRAVANVPAETCAISIKSPRLSAKTSETARNAPKLPTAQHASVLNASARRYLPQKRVGRRAAREAFSASGSADISFLERLPPSAGSPTLRAAEPPAASLREKPQTFHFDSDVSIAVKFRIGRLERRAQPISAPGAFLHKADRLTPKRPADSTRQISMPLSESGDMRQ